MYGLKQGAHAWNRKLHDVLTELGFKRSKIDQSLYIRRENNGSVVYLAVYVDDLLLFTNNQELKRTIINQLEEKFKMRNLGPVSMILGINIHRNRQTKEIFLDQTEYIENILRRFNLENCNLVRTPLDVNQTLIKDMSPKTAAEKKEMEGVPYREALGSLMYAYQGTRPDLGSAVTILSSFAENPGKAHWNALKRTLRYLKGTKDLRLKFNDSGSMELVGYYDANWAGDTDSRRSTSGYVFLLGNCAVSWCSKRQQTVSLSTTESEYIAIALAVQELLWLKRLIKDIDNSCVREPIRLHSDN